VNANVDAGSKKILLLYDLIIHEKKQTNTFSVDALIPRD